MSFQLNSKKSKIAEHYTILKVLSLENILVLPMIKKCYHIMESLKTYRIDKINQDDSNDI